MPAVVTTEVAQASRVYTVWMRVLTFTPCAGSACLQLML